MRLEANFLPEMTDQLIWLGTQQLLQVLDMEMSIP